MIVMYIFIIVYFNSTSKTIKYYTTYTLQWAQ